MEMDEFDAVGRFGKSPGAALLLKLLNFSCSRCLFLSDHSDHFLVNINKHPCSGGRDGDSHR